MSIFVWILLIIAGIIALLLIIGLFSKKNYAFQREVIIQKPKQVVFDYVKMLKNQDHFNKWVMRVLKDPAVKTQFTGTDGTPGFIYAWEHKGGAGEQEIMNIEEGKRVDIQIRFKRPFKGISDSFFETTGETGTTNLKWSFSSQLNYPMNILLLFMNMEQMLGKDLAESLSNVKAILEK